MGQKCLRSLFYILNFLYNGMFISQGSFVHELNSKIFTENSAVALTVGRFYRMSTLFGLPNANSFFVVFFNKQFSGFSLVIIIHKQL